MLEYLLKRVDDLENLIDEMKNFMIGEDKTKQDLLTEFETQEKKVAEYQNTDQMVISKKVKKELKNHLESAAQKVIEIEKERDAI